MCDSAEAVRQMTKVMGNTDGITISMPCAPMPVSTGEAPDFVHPRVGLVLDRIRAQLHKRRTHTSSDEEGTLLEESSSGYSQCSAAIQAIC